MKPEEPLEQPEQIPVSKKDLDNVYWLLDHGIKHSKPTESGTEAHHYRMVCCFARLALKFLLEPDCQDEPLDPYRKSKKNAPT